MSTDQDVVSFTTACLFDALLLLMEEKDFDDISISELCGKAGIARSTFYRRFSDKESVIAAYFIEHTQNSFDEEEIKENNNLKMMDKGLRFLEEHKRELTILAKAENPKIWGALYRTVAGMYRGQFAESSAQMGASTHLEIAAYAGSFFILEMEWIIGGFKESRAEVIQSYYNVVNKDWLRNYARRVAQQKAR